MDKQCAFNKVAAARGFTAYPWGWLVFISVLIFPPPIAAQDGAIQIKSELARLQQSLKDKPLSSPDTEKMNGVLADWLKGALQAESAGRHYLSLEGLGRAADLTGAMRALTDREDTVKTGMPGYEAEWERTNVLVNTLNRKTQEHDWSNGQAAIQALSQAAQGKTGPLLDGGRGFAVANGPKDGLPYLGEAQAEAEFAAFVASLPLSRQHAPYPVRSFLPELESFQQKANAAFKPPRSIDLHVQFMVLNSALKLGKELDASKMYAGALYQYLEAVLAYGMLDAPPVEAAQQTALKDSFAAVCRKLDASPRDESLAQVFVERAQSQLSHPDGSAPSADDWRGAKVIVEQVLPAYFAADHPLAAQARASGKTVDVTLVRWPYT